MKLYCNTVYGQNANTGDAGIEISSGAANTEVKNNIVYNTAKPITNSGTNTTLANNLTTTDPKFVNATNTVTGSGGGLSHSTSFRLTVTAPPPPLGAMPANFTAAFFGDQGNISQTDAVLRLIKNKGAQLVIHVGDLDHADSPTTFDNKITNILGSEFPYLVTRGNHDVAAWGGPSGYQAKLQARIDRYNTDPATPLSTESFALVQSSA